MFLLYNNFVFSALVAVLQSTVAVAQVSDAPCSTGATRLHLSDPPYDNYFYSDCHSGSHALISSPLPTSNLDRIRPRLLIGWPAGNSGIVTYFEPESGQKGTLGVQFRDSTSTGNTLDPIYDARDSEQSNPRVGISGSINFNTSAVLTIPILGDIRTMRNYVEGGGIPEDMIQKAIRTSESDGGGVTLNRTWLDNVTTTWLTFTPLDGADHVTIKDQDLNTLRFGLGTYQFNASFNYPQLQQLSPSQVLSSAAQDLIKEYPDQTSSLSFLSYKDKLLAGSWRFLTYFGRDSMITLLLMQSVLSEGEGGAIEAGIASVLDRTRKSDGTTCHEEVIGDFATYLNIKDGNPSTDPRCDYHMIDTDFYLPTILKNYFVDTETGSNRASAFFDTTASFLKDNAGVRYSQLALANAEKVMRSAAPFASQDGQTKENLIHLNANERNGEWRDSGDGLGGGRIPYDVNAALVPASLRAIAELSRKGFFPEHADWSEKADQYAKVWEDETLKFFEVSVSQSEAKDLVANYAKDNFPGPDRTGDITSNVTFYGLALDGDNNTPVVRVMNTDDCFRHFLLNTTKQDQLSKYLEQTADNILRTFPAGLSSDVGLIVSNPAYSGEQRVANQFKVSDYHGTVIWSWQLAMMGGGLARQLGRCDSNDAPDFCGNKDLHAKIVKAYNTVWDQIDANRGVLTNEVWSWTYDGKFKVEPLGSFTSSESNIVQLWSLTFLAVNRQTFTAPTR